MKKNILSLMLFVCGFIVGITIFSFLARQAASSYADSIRINYQIEQQLLAIKSKKNDDYKTAVNHYKNIVESSNFSIKCFEKSKNLWTLGYPFFSFFNKIIGIGKIERSNKTEGIYRALLSDALEKEGDLDAAIIELKKASILLGLENETDRAKKIAIEVLKSEDTLLVRE